MNSTHSIWHNGELIPWEKSQVHVLAHGLHYGSGIFEGIRYYKTERGPAIFRLPEHVDRFINSANAIKMSLPYTKLEIITAVKQVVHANQIEAGYIRPIAFYNSGDMGLNPVKNTIEFFIACWPWNKVFTNDSIDVKVCDYIRITPTATNINAKLCGNYVNGTLASLSLIDTHYHAVLLKDINGYLAEGAGENFFIVKDKTLYTPKRDYIFAGITRDTVIQIAGGLNYPVVETDILPKQAEDADEAFFSGTAVEIMPIRSINDRILGNAGINSIVETIKKSYSNITTGRDINYLKYLTYLFV